MSKPTLSKGKSVLSKSVSPGVIAKALLVSYLITVPVFMVFSLMLTYTDFPERYTMPAVVITTIVSILIAGSTVTRNAKSRGWLNGGMVGLLYIFILYIVSSIVFNNFTVDKYVITMAVIGAITGSIGGIIGINMKSSSHSRVKRR